MTKTIRRDTPEKIRTIELRQVTYIDDDRRPVTRWQAAHLETGIISAGASEREALSNLEDYLSRHPTRET